MYCSEHVPDIDGLQRCLEAAWASGITYLHKHKYRDTYHLEEKVYLFTNFFLSFSQDGMKLEEMN